MHWIKPHDPSAKQKIDENLISRCDFWQKCPQEYPRALGTTDTQTHDPGLTTFAPAEYLAPVLYKLPVPKERLASLMKARAFFGSIEMNL